MSGFWPRAILYVEKPGDDARTQWLWSLLHATGHQVYAVAEWTWRPAIPLRRLTPDTMPARWPDGWANVLAIPPEQGAAFHAHMARGTFVIVEEW